MSLTSLSECQKKALIVLESSRNVFLTGVAGSGKSFLIREFRKRQGQDRFPVLASTGAAAILVQGRTFHSFFGLGILQQGVEATIKRAVKNSRVKKRIKDAEGIIIDEISMLSAPTLLAAEGVCREVRNRSKPWGGLRVIVTGDFAQLPPVTRSGMIQWAFDGVTWKKSNFLPAILKTVMRTSDEAFLRILNFVREGVVNDEVSDFLNERTEAAKELYESDYQGTLLFPRRNATEQFNLQKLSEIDGEVHEYETKYTGEGKFIERLKTIAPIPENLCLKIGALVMLRQNDPKRKWMNGSIGTIEEFSDDEIEIELTNRRNITVEKAKFDLLDAEGNVVATAENFPINLAWASTIHKAQGMTLDSVRVDLNNLWEPGHAYVALSRAKNASSLYVSAWSPRSIRVDPTVKRFYEELGQVEIPYLPQGGASRDQLKWEL